MEEFEVNIMVAIARVANLVGRLNIKTVWVYLFWHLCNFKEGYKLVRH